MDTYLSMFRIEYFRGTPFGSSKQVFIISGRLGGLDIITNRLHSAPNEVNVSPLIRMHVIDLTGSTASPDNILLWLYDVFVTQAIKYCIRKIWLILKFTTLLC
ncbi:uncharacterized protein PHALS_10381 [Plasmopara halstedii]|uniref:Uncharacterized protein n=1 Tax=Plasmopara halstedii TaxID=4781 RepID=A0A0P1AHG9_PLAHL|nr:uncharacterized protein PHALS_10381 [Plasmopara halstedii]CEG40168.1 hypothetical protein PHALS_10381 [Plasmopara halstedii]|eukprot:XP_024576537.1 hypothetical protein PHALS_10381 [Plasmopara halstedii]